VEGFDESGNHKFIPTGFMRIGVSPGGGRSSCWMRDDRSGSIHSFNIRNLFIHVQVPCCFEGERICALEMLGQIEAHLRVMGGLIDALKEDQER
jgi:hypothetical protein